MSKILIDHNHQAPCLVCLQEHDHLRKQIVMLKDLNAQNQDSVARLQKENYALEAEKAKLKLELAETKADRDSWIQQTEDARDMALKEIEIVGVAKFAFKGIESGCRCIVQPCSGCSKYTARQALVRIAELEKSEVGETK